MLPTFLVVASSVYGSASEKIGSASVVEISITSIGTFHVPVNIHPDTWLYQYYMTIVEVSCQNSAIFKLITELVRYRDETVLYIHSVLFGISICIILSLDLQAVAVTALLSYCYQSRH